MKEASRGLTLLVTALFAGGIAASLGACGSDNTQTDSTGARSPQGAVASESPARVTAQKHDRPAAPEIQTDDSSSERTNRGDGTGVPTKVSGPANSNSAVVDQATDGTCPAQLSGRKCRELALAANGGPSKVRHTAETGQCPQSLDKRSCRELSEAESPAASGSAPVTPGECPPALSEAQCRQLEAASKGSK